MKDVTITSLNRHQLGGISVEDIKDPMDKMTQNQRKQYVAKVAAAYSWLEDEIKRAIAAQGNFAIRFAETWEQTLVGRGGINLGEVLLERFNALKSEHLENVKPKEEFNEHDVI